MTASRSTSRSAANHGPRAKWNIGALSVRQDEFEALPADNATVARASANLLGESNLGMIVTEGNPGSTVDNSLVGADFLYCNSRLPGGKPVEVNAWAQESDSEGETADERARAYDSPRRTTPAGAAASVIRASARVSIRGSGF